jgi:hypothetical protein
MASIRKPKVVSTVKRDKPASTSASAKANGGPRLTDKEVARIAAPPKRKSVAQVKAKASRDAVMKAFPKKAKAVSVTPPEIVREEPHILESQNGKPLAKRLNATLRKQLADRKVTNAVAAAALGVSETYLSRTVAALGVEKAPGKTTAHRNARHELAAARNAHRASLAKTVNKGNMTIEAAAKAANCSVRTMFRWCEKYANVKKAA